MRASERDKETLKNNDFFFFFFFIDRTQYNPLWKTGH